MLFSFFSAVVILCSLGGCAGICVLDNKHGWNVECGIRDSYLFRIKDLGGIKANFDFGFGVGDEKGFPQSIKNTGGHHRKNDDDTSINSDYQPSRYGNQPPGHIRRDGLNSQQPRQWQQHIDRERTNRPSAPAPSLRPPPSFDRQNQPVIQRQQLGRPRPPARRRPLFPFRSRPRTPPRTPPPRSLPQGQFQHQGVAGDNVGSSFQVFHQNHIPTPTPAPSTLPTIGPTFAELLKVDADTPADTDHVPSFAAKMFVVRQAPPEFFPPGYEVNGGLIRPERQVEVPRTKFFCEEQKYFPGIYADTQLGCKVFHLCLPAALGNTLTSFLCPNMTLFDQSIMQCNWWYHVKCENAPLHYDANLPVALSYRRINAAQLPLAGIKDFNTVSLLSHNAKEMKEHGAVSPAHPAIAQNVVLRRRMSKNGQLSERRRGVFSSPGFSRRPRKMTSEEVTTDSAEESDTEEYPEQGYVTEMSSVTEEREEENKESTTEAHVAEEEKEEEDNTGSTTETHPTSEEEGI